MLKNISSDKKRILVFSDVHQDAKKAKDILKKEDYDHIVFLGDWFDSHHKQSASDLAATCSLVRELSAMKNFTQLWANHDLQYFYSNRYVLCSGYSEARDAAIADMLHPRIAEIRDSIGWYVWIDDFLCTHAGVHPYFFPSTLELTKEGITKWLDEEIKKVKITIESGGSHWFYRAGAARYGNQKYGGVVWLDFDKEFEPVEGLKQIVGHTYNHHGFGVRAHHTNGNLNLAEANDLCIDCNIVQYLIIENGKVEIKNYSDL
jgi:Calcineurin-like phosphoesterase